MHRVLVPTSTIYVHSDYRAVHTGGTSVPVVLIVAGALLVLLAGLIARHTAHRTGRTRVAA